MKQATLKPEHIQLIIGAIVVLAALATLIGQNILSRTPHAHASTAIPVTFHLSSPAGSAIVKGVQNLQATTSGCLVNGSVFNLDPGQTITLIPYTSKNCTGSSLSKTYPYIPQQSSSATVSYP